MRSRGACQRENGTVSLCYQFIVILSRILLCAHNCLRIVLIILMVREFFLLEGQQCTRPGTITLRLGKETKAPPETTFGRRQIPTPLQQLAAAAVGDWETSGSTVLKCYSSWWLHIFFIAFLCWLVIKSNFSTVAGIYISILCSHELLCHVQGNSYRFVA